MKPHGGGNPLEHYAAVTIYHDASGTAITSPTSEGETLIIPPGAVRFRVKTAGTVHMLLSDDTNPGGVLTQETTDGFVEHCVGGSYSRSGRYPTQIVLSAAADFAFDCVTPDGAER